MATAGKARISVEPTHTAAEIDITGVVPFEVNRHLVGSAGQIKAILAAILAAVNLDLVC